MPTEIFRVDSYDFVEADALFIDTNVWLYVYAPQAPDDKRTRVYSRALASILSAKSRIFIDAMVLSEYINRYSRLAYNLFKAAGSTIDFKEYRHSSDFKPVAKDIESSVRRILKHCHRTESGFLNCDINSLLAKYGEGDADFNDQLMVELCKSKGFKLITHDRDFRDCCVTVLTANSRLLA